MSAPELVVVVVAVALFLALFNYFASRFVEAQHPPIGRFIEADGVRLHYVDRGAGPAVVLLHGNITMLEDFLTSGVVEEAAKRYRVIVFDRPGFGYSTRPRDRTWTPGAQAAVLAEAIDRLNARPCVAVGHSWGALTALSLAENHRDIVAAVVLISGFYFRRFRADVLIAALQAMPVVGDVLRYTILPLSTAAFLPFVLRVMFGPPAIPPRFREEFPKLMMARPWQLRASSEDGALLLRSADVLSPGYPRLASPAVIVAGTKDRVVSIEEQSEKLHRVLARSHFDRLPGLGHMVHHEAPERIVNAIDTAAALGGLQPRGELREDRP